MVSIGRKIYFDKPTGDVLVDTGERSGFVSKTTLEQDISTYKVLSERNRNTFDVIELEFGQYTQDFIECNGYQVNPETKELEFSYPDPNDEDQQESVYQAPLSEEVETLKARQDATENAVLDLLIMGGM